MAKKSNYSLTSAATRYLKGAMKDQTHISRIDDENIFVCASHSAFVINQVVYNQFVWPAVSDAAPDVGIVNSYGDHRSCEYNDVMGLYRSTFSGTRPAKITGIMLESGKYTLGIVAGASVDGEAFLAFVDVNLLDLINPSMIDHIFMDSPVSPLRIEFKDGCSAVIMPFRNTSVNIEPLKEIKPIIPEA